MVHPLVPIVSIIDRRRIHQTCPQDMRPRRGCLNGAGTPMGFARTGCLPLRHAQKTRARGTPDARCVRSLMRKAKSARVSHHESTETSGVPHAVRLPACFVRSPAAIDTLGFVTVGTKQCGRERPDLVSCGRLACRRSVPWRQRRASGPHDFGRRAKATRVGRISAPARAAQRRRPALGSAAP